MANPYKAYIEEYREARLAQWRREDAIATALRFWDQVEIGISCWEWLGARNRNGYGTFFWAEDRTQIAHRLAYELMVDVIPDGLQLDHLCRNRGCVNPEHLEPVTAEENNRRAQHRPQDHPQALKTHCPKGHPYSIANTYHSQGRRKCRECGRMFTKAWLQMKRKDPP